MKYVILSLAAGFIIIGVHQTMLFGQQSITEGIAASYWLFMFALGMLFWYQHLKKKEKNAGASQQQVRSTAKAEQPSVKTSGKKRKKPKKIG